MKLRQPRPQEVIVQETVAEHTMAGPAVTQPPVVPEMIFSDEGAPPAPVAAPAAPDPAVSAPAAVVPPAALASEAGDVVTGRVAVLRHRLLPGLAVAALALGAGLFSGAIHPVLAAVLAGVGVALYLSVPADSRPAPAPAVPSPAPAAPKPERRDSQAAAVVAALPEPALLLTAHGEIMMANERVALAIGPTKVGDPLSFVVRVPEVLDAVRAAAADGIPRRVEFAERIPLDRWLEAHVVPLRLDSAGRKGEEGPDAVLLTFRDLTQQRRVEQMRADFVANASHELRTPLASLSGFIETLQGPARNDTPARERFLTIMAAQARRMSRLIDDLLSLSRIELNAHVRPQTPVDLASILAHVCDTLSPIARDRGVALEQIKEAERLEVLGDRDELIRLFENLVENALKYGADGKSVEIRLAREGQATVVSVRDFGPGIAPEHLPRLTERFYRVDVAASREQGGTGLGLAIVKHIVARHRGRLGVESVLGQGATFTVRMDASPERGKSVEKATV
ncbi:ATP-binding protein [Xanthobacter autotrophicus DSM 431]|uniref:ATP-binding protein n=1 Tax=Xanthobacter nonsaccharivorans TaxID=3119912 RepID=UPI0037266DBD